MTAGAYSHFFDESAAELHVEHMQALACAHCAALQQCHPTDATHGSCLKISCDMNVREPVRMLGMTQGRPDVSTTWSHWS